MIRPSDTGAGLDVHSYLVAFCALAFELYPGESWTTVESKLERSWERYMGDGLCHWEDVRDAAHSRWVTRATAAA